MQHIKVIAICALTIAALALAGCNLVPQHHDEPVQDEHKLRPINH